MFEESEKRSDAGFGGFGVVEHDAPVGGLRSPMPDARALFGATPSPGLASREINDIPPLPF